MQSTEQFCYAYVLEQEAPLSPSDCAMRLVSSNLANYHATVQKILIRQVLTKPMVWIWRFSWRQCVIKKPTTVELCISPVYRRLAVAKFSKSTMWKLLTWPWPRPLTKHSLITSLRLCMADPCTKFEVSSFSRCGDITRGVKFQNGSPNPDHAPFREAFLQQGGTCYGKSM